MSAEWMLSHESRLNTVLEYIDNNLEKNISVAQLSDLVCFSRFHFHRLFLSMVGMSAGKYIRLLRFKKVSYQLAFRTHLSITDIAIDAGFDSVASFSREFKKTLGISPSSFRKEPDWPYWRQVFEPLYAPVQGRLDRKKSLKMQDEISLKEVKIIDFVGTTVAVKEHIGPPNKVMHSVLSFIKWRKNVGLSPVGSATYNIFYDDSATAEPNDYRMDICTATQADIAPNEQGVIKKTIPAGLCAVMRHVGSDSLLGQNIHFLYANWLPQSGQQLRDFPVFIERVNLYPDVPEQQAIIDIYLPLA